MQHRDRPLGSTRTAMFGAVTSALLLAVLASAPIACHSQAPAAPAHEASVRPGINDRYLDPELDIDASIKQFEVESREIYTERRAIVAAMGLRQGMDVADIGAGTGLFMEPFAKSIGPTGTLYAVEIAPPFVKHLAERAAKLELTNVKPRLCAEDSIGMPVGSIDMAFVCDTYHHFEYPMSTLASIHGALRDGGTLVIIDFIREPGVSREWVLGHVRAGESVVRAEIESAGFRFLERVTIPGFRENYYLVFTKR